MAHDENFDAIRRMALTDPALYGDAFADVYDAWYAGLNDADFVAAVARRMNPQPQRVLELGVGTGRLARLLHHERHPVIDSMTGIDASEQMLARARNAGVNGFMTLLQGDFSVGLPDGEFDMVFVGYNTLFNLPTTESVARCLGLVSHGLARDGVFMIDAVIPRGTSVEEHSETRTMANGDVVHSASLHDPVARTVTGYFSHVVDGHHGANDSAGTVRRWNVHYVLPDDLDALASAAGLALESRWADGTGARFEDDSSRHVSTYVKR